MPQYEWYVPASEPHLVRREDGAVCIDAGSRIAAERVYRLLNVFEGLPLTDDDVPVLRRALEERCKQRQLSAAGVQKHG